MKTFTLLLSAAGVVWAGGMSIPVLADPVNQDAIVIAKDQTRTQDRDRLRDQSCLDAIDAARAALDRDRTQDAKREMDRARDECDRDRDRDQDRDQDRTQQGK